MSGGGDKLGLGKAAEVTAEVTGLPALIRIGEDLIMKLAGPACEEAGLWAGDKVRKRRLGVVAARTNQIIEDEGIEPKEVPLRTLAPLAEAASFEDDPDLQEMWAQLLATAAHDPDEVPAIFVNAMRQLGPAEAHELRRLTPPSPGWRSKHASIPLIRVAPTFAALNLEAIGLARRVEYSVGVKSDLFSPEGFQLFRSELGTALLRAVSGKARQEPE